MPGRAGPTAPRRHRSGPVCWCAEVRRWARRSRRRRSAPARCGPRGRARRPDKVARDPGAPGPAGARRAILYRRSGGGAAAPPGGIHGAQRTQAEVPTAWPASPPGTAPALGPAFPRRAQAMRRRSRGRRVLVGVRAFGHVIRDLRRRLHHGQPQPAGPGDGQPTLGHGGTYAVGQGSPDQALQRRQQLQVDQPCCSCWRVARGCHRHAQTLAGSGIAQLRHHPLGLHGERAGDRRALHGKFGVPRCGSSPAGFTTIDQPEWSARGSIRSGRSRRKRNTRAAPAPVVAIGSSQAVTSGRLSDRQPATEASASGNTTQSCRPRSNTAAGTARPQRKRSSISPGSLRAETLTAEGGSDWAAAVALVSATGPIAPRSRFVLGRFDSGSGRECGIGIRRTGPAAGSIAVSATTVPGGDSCGS